MQPPQTLSFDRAAPVKPAARWHISMEPTLSQTSVPTAVGVTAASQEIAAVTLSTSLPTLAQEPPASAVTPMSAIDSAQLLLPGTVNSSSDESFGVVTEALSAERPANAPVTRDTTDSYVIQSMGSTVSSS